MPEWLHIIIRSSLFILLIIITARILGKKQISEITFLEYISGIIIGVITGIVVLETNQNIIHGILAVIFFGAVTIIIDFLNLKSMKFRGIIEGKSAVLIQNGKIMEDNLKKEKYTLDDLGSLLRGKNVFNLAEVEFAILEPNGELNVLLKKEHRPVTPKDINLKVANEKEPQTVIMDGKIIDNALSDSGKSRAWLMIELDKLGVTLDNVFFGQIDAYGELTVDVYDDQLNIPSPQSRPLLMAMIKKCQSDMESFALETNSSSAKSMYQSNAVKLDGVIASLSPYLNH